MNESRFIYIYIFFFLFNNTSITHFYVHFVTIVICGTLGWRNKWWIHVIVTETVNHNLPQKIIVVKCVMHYYYFFFQNILFPFSILNSWYHFFSSLTLFPCSTSSSFSLFSLLQCTLCNSCIRYSFYFYFTALFFLYFFIYKHHFPPPLGPPLLSGDRHQLSSTL